MERLGAPGAGLAIALENLFPPLPSELILPLAGFTASRGSFTLAEAIGWTTAGSVVGAMLLYVLGVLIGRRRIYWVWERLPLVKVEDLEKTEAWFGRHGRKAVFFGRMIPIFRSLISVPAGLERMPFGQFLLLTLAGSAIWNTVFVLAGYWLGEQWHRVEEYVGVFQWIVIGTVLAAVCWWLVVRVRAIRHERRST
ncbi:DedA family protein [Nocardioides sp. zg-578]|uniref:DedA family protein n=2 Tax=Nocardioides marmotae TaxID=2663857 RepID=A0A6I3JFI5_9ACTN|nr:DedA family protein [Nocardioides marmotae]MCR6033207.1 DedA family protein [Gordonia jinghuaiqii]MTB83830.1 DedA family protein [Nocardioides marmotae]MTB96862.1 DedA family protein [Nocardioides marmotae]QKE03681.1 DedA family protein [Nocardioides marmotae]